ncbi:MAG: hypothetical protein MUF54_21645 [Polyangiaceae bacterium]|nr:hypothetical protein [Polyangiaceae bacterium]
MLLDKIGGGTSTHDGPAIAWAVAEHLRNMPHLLVLDGAARPPRSGFVQRRLGVRGCSTGRGWAHCC